MNQSNKSNEESFKSFKNKPHERNTNFTTENHQLDIKQKLESSIFSLQEAFSEWREANLIDQKINEYKEKIEFILHFSTQKDEEFYAFIKEDLDIKSSYHHELIENKLKNFVSNMKKEITEKISKFEINSNYDTYTKSYDQLKSIDMNVTDNLISFVKLRHSYSEAYEKLEKFRIWHSELCYSYTKFKDMIKQISFDVPEEINDLTKNCRSIYDNFEKISRERNYMAATRYSLTINYDDLYRLKPYQWLNEKIINFYSEYLIEKMEGLRYENNNRQSLLLFKSFFFATLTSTVISMQNYNYSRIIKFTSKYVDKDCIFYKFEKIGYIVNITDTHWVFVVIDNQNHKIILYDSLKIAKENAHDEVILKIFRSYIKDEVKDKRNITEHEAEKFANEYRLDIGSSPIQPNGYDCGVYLCKNMSLFSKGEEITKTSYSITDITEFRFKLFELIVKIGINPDGFLKYDELF